MALLEKQLFIKRSQIPGAGKGLFTKKLIAKGIRIVEYKGKVSAWNEVPDRKVYNGYIYYINRYQVIDAMLYKKALARYANDAKGITKVEDLTNNSRYIKDNGRVYIVAIKDIEAGSEILVGYKKEYWDAIIYNKKLAAYEERLKKRKEKPSK